MVRQQKRRNSQAIFTAQEMVWRILGHTRDGSVSRYSQRVISQLLPYFDAEFHIVVHVTLRERYTLRERVTIG